MIFDQQQQQASTTAVQDAFFLPDFFLEYLVSFLVFLIIKYL